MPRSPWRLLKEKSKARLEQVEAPSPAASSTSNVASGADREPAGPSSRLPEIEAESRRGLWDQAYEDLRKEKGAIIEALEDLLKSEPEIQSLSLASLDKKDPSKREKQMYALTNKKLAMMNEQRWRFNVGDKSVEVREQVDRIVKVILVAKDVISSVASMEPIHAGLPWAGVCMLLPLFVNDSKQRAAAVDGLEYISKLVRRFTEMELLYFQREQYALRGDLEAAVVKLYRLVLEYEARAACQFNRKTPLQIARNIVGADGWEDILEKVKESEAACEKLMRTIDIKDQRTSMQQLEAKMEKQNEEVDKLLRASRLQDDEYEKQLLSEVKAGREEQKDWHRSEKESKCFETLRTTDYEFNKDKNPNRVPGTCEWFLQHRRYQKWLDKQGSSWLWVTADPGCGKSVLSKFLIDDFMKTKSTDTSICYFFFKDDSETSKSAVHALCALLHQLFSQNNALLAHAIPEFHRNGEKLPRLFETLWNIFTSAIEDPHAGSVICILDALDECEESTRLPLIRKLAEFYSSRNSNARLGFIITSRPNTPIGDTIWHSGEDPASIQLAGENEAEMKAIGVEIDLFIKEKVKQFKILRVRRGVTDDAHDAIQEQLDNIENRTYLWVSLIFPELEKNAGTPKHKLLKTVRTIPSTVYEAYEKILSQSSDKELAKRLLQIVLVAVRPLTLLEMNRALSIEVDEDDRSQDRQELEAEASFRKTVRELCGLFVSIQDGKVYLIHQTAKEFLVSKTITAHSITHGNSWPTTWKHSLELVESNLVLARICISYLLSDTFEIDPFVMSSSYGINLLKMNRYTEQHDFIHYSANNWATHFRETKIKDIVILELALKICEPRSQRFLTWFGPYRLTRREDIPDVQGLTKTIIACYLGREEIIELLLENGADLEAKDSYNQTPLLLATQRGHKEITELLLENGADLEARDLYGRTPLLLAAQRGHDEILELLIQKDADIEARDLDGETPLLLAVQSCHDEIIELLLEKGADLEAMDLYGRTPLLWAVQRGHERIIEFLLEKGANLEGKDNCNETPIFFAVRQSHEVVIKRLVERGANLEAKDDAAATPLAIAALIGRQAVMKLLVEMGADLEAKDRYGRTPLFYAKLGRGGEAAVKYLVEKGAVMD